MASRIDSSKAGSRYQKLRESSRSEAGDEYRYNTTLWSDSRIDNSETDSRNTLSEATREQQECRQETDTSLQ